MNQHSNNKALILGLSLLLCISFSSASTLNITFSCTSLGYDTATNLTKYVTGLGDYHFNHSLISYRNNVCMPEFVTEYDLISFSNAATNANSSIAFKSNKLNIDFYSSGTSDPNLAIAIKLNSSYKVTNDSIAWLKYSYFHGSIGENNKFIAFYMDGALVGGTIKTLKTSGVTGDRDFNDTLDTSINASWETPFIFNEIVFTVAGLGATKLNISNIAISNLEEYGSNSYPDVNISLEKVCVNQTGDTVRIPYNVTGFDREGDDILTSIYLQTYAYKNVQKIVSFQKSVGGVLFPQFYPNYDDLEQSFFPDACYINTESISDPEHILNWTNIRDFNGNDNQYMLNLNSNCRGIPKYVYNIKYSLNSIVYSSKMYGMDQVNETFNLTFYDVNLNEVLKVKVLVFNSTHTKFYSWNGTDFRPLFAVANQGNFNQYHYFMIFQFSRNLTIAPLFRYITGNDAFTLNYTTREPVQYIEYSYNGNMYQDGFSYGGLLPNITLGQLSDTGELTAYYGSYTVSLYYSDNVHSPLYETKNFSGYVDLCKYTSLGGEETNLTKNFKPGSFFESILGRSMRSYYSQLDPGNIGRSVLWVLYFTFLILFIIGVYLESHKFDLIFPVVAMSLLFMVPSALMKYTDMLISFAIITCFALAIPIASSLLWGQSGGTKNG